MWMSKTSGKSPGARRASPVLATLLLAACSATGLPPAHVGAAYAPLPGGQRLDAAALGELGRALFFEPALSASGQMSCASCHDPAHAYGPPDGRPLPLAGADGRVAGARAVPSLRYLQALPPFSEHAFDNDGDDSVDAGPTGGYLWDGRVSSLHEQARLPLLSPSEMANPTPAAVVAAVRRGPLAPRLAQVFGATVLDDERRAFDAVLLALEAFQQSPRDFYPYSSRYDEFLRGRAVLSPRELRGLALFDDPAKGHCAACHRSAPSADGALPLFTDFGHVALGVPRNAALASNADPASFDLGLCGPLRTDLRDRPDLCGRFRTPGLRNVALRQAFFHNGRYATLEEVLRFYARRDTDPQEFYPRQPDGTVQRYDDLPAAMHGNVDTEAPFGRRPGDRPALDEAEIGDIVAFLKTLTDADMRVGP